MMTVYCLFLFYFGYVSSQSNTDVQNLHTLLFTTNSYNTLIRPSLDQSKTLEVYLGFTLYGINGVDEIEQKLTTTGWLDIYWKDELLTWTPSSYGNLQYIYVPQSNVWKPDLSLQNGFKDLEELGSKFIQVQILYNGTVSWRPFQIFESKCSLDSTYFPFDKQKCDLEFVAWSLEREDVYLAQSLDGIDLSHELESHGEWDIISSKATNELESTETKVVFSITIQRKPLYVLINMIMPILLLSLLSIFTFRIPADSGERMGYTVTVWLSFAVFLTIVSGSLPQSSENIPIISIYIIIQLIMGTLTVLCSAVEAGVTTYEDDVPIPRLIRMIAIFFRRKQIKAKDTENDKEDKASPVKDVSWKEAVRAMDICYFWFCFLVFIVSTLIVFIIIGTN